MDKTPLAAADSIPVMGACCAAPVIVDGNDVMRRCQSCGAEWQRSDRVSEWQRVPSPPSPAAGFPSVKSPR